VRTLARKVGLPHSTVHVMLNASELQPHRIRTFTFSPDPEFEPKLLEIVGLYLKPPENALVLYVDEKPEFRPWIAPSLCYRCGPRNRRLGPMSTSVTERRR